jgi:CBS-domain-containing membrane protein
MAAADRQRLIAKLVTARNDLDDVLEKSISISQRDLATIPQPLRNELTVMRDDLTRIIRQIEELEGGLTI